MAPVRVLHIIGKMERGGVETWLMQLLRNLDRARIHMDFLALDPGPAHFDAEIRSLGSRVIVDAAPPSPIRFAWRLYRVLRAGRYDVVHCHVHSFSGYVLGIARLAGVPIRIAHSHSNTSQREQGAGPVRRLYLASMRAAIWRYGTRGLGASQECAAVLFGAGWRDDPRWGVLYCALDFSPFRAPVDRAAVRAELGIPADAFVVIHVGRFDEPKNHRFLLRIAAEVLRGEPRAHFLLVGDGPLHPVTREEAVRLGIRDRVLFAGVRPDVPRLLRACDLFLLPSLREGLPLVGLEAQAAGLPIVLSDHVTRELEVVPGLFGRRSLSDPPEAWAATLISMLHGPRPKPEDALAAMECSDFSLQRSLHLLDRLYGLTPASERSGAEGA
jgi:glycosyltransferase involved in cell wall biosynthesis